ncbi:MAG: cobalt chelatase [Burkholderiaceae bacterium]
MPPSQPGEKASEGPVSEAPGTVDNPQGDATNAAALARHQQQVEELCAASVRALTGDANLHYRDKRLYRGRQPLAIRAPHLRTEHETDDFGSYRGATDGVSQRLNHSDPGLHVSLKPEDTVDALVFEMLEQFRVEALVPDHMVGMKKNLVHRFHAWSRAFYRSGLTESGLGILLYTVAQMTWSRLTNQQVLEETEDLIESTRGGLGPQIGKDLAQLPRTKHDQKIYAVHALRIASMVGDMVRDAEAQEQSVRGDGDQPDDGKTTFALFIEFEGEESDHYAVATTGRSSVMRDAGDEYQVFTSQYDSIQAAASLVRAEELIRLREKLDVVIGGHAFNLDKLTRQLIQMLAIPRTDGWLFGEEEGQLDGRRLTQLLTSPAERRVFRKDRYRPRANSAVSILIDCSGSMKSVIEPLAMVTDVLVRAMQQAGIPSEILGFTTGAWNGGRPQRDWLRGGRPRHPGRLNETSLMIFKEAAQTWRRSRANIAALLKPDLFREGVDGEAVEWACLRLNAIDAQRKILIVVSDGSPNDTATTLANDEHYLDNHLKAVVARHEQIRDVEIRGLGVGLDLSPFYSHCLATDLSRPVDNRLFQEILELISGRHHR